MKNLLFDTIYDLIQDHLRDKPVLVWYDMEGSLQHVISDVIAVCPPSNPHLVVYDGSYLKIRDIIESTDPKFEKKWLIYIPEVELEQSWIRDYETIGSKVSVDLEKILVEKAGLTSNIKIRALLQGESGKLLVSHWDSAIGDKITITLEDIISGLLSTVFNIVSDFTINRAVLEYVSFPSQYDMVMHKYNLHDSFAELISSKLGLDNDLTT